jgi:hypothetical protein
MLSFLLQDEAVVVKFQQDLPVPIFNALNQFKQDQAKVTGPMVGFFVNQLRKDPNFLRNYATDKTAFDAEMDKIQAELNRIREEHRNKRPNV